MGIKTVKRVISSIRAIINLAIAEEGLDCSEECVIHLLRHSMRDRLRVVECPSDIIDAIGGWTTTGVGQRYGLGQPLDVKAKWMHLILGQD